LFSNCHCNGRLLFAVNECAAVLNQRGVLQSTGARFDELISDTKDSFRLYASLEQFLKWPTKFGEQLVYQINPEMQKTMVDK